MQIKFLFLVLSLVLIGCVKTNDKEIEAYFRTKGDSLCLYAYWYLREQLSPRELEYLTIDKSFLTQDIEKAVSIYKERLETSYVPFGLFEEYVLPPFIEDEPLENWREKCLDKFSFLKNLNMVEFCDTVNSLLGRDFSFSYGEIPARYLSWSYLDTLRKGDCFHMAKLVLYPLRAFGYPCTIDFTPCWGNVTGGHSWNVIYIGGKMIPFMGCEKGIYSYEPFQIYNFESQEKQNPARYPGKVYRKTFSMNKKLKQLLEYVSIDDLPPFLSDCRIMDVTAEYLPVSDVEIEVTDTIFAKELVFLAVYSDDWTVTAYADAYQNRIATFKDMKNEMLYMPIVYRKGNIYPIDYPFIVDRFGEKRFLIASNSTEKCVVSYLLPLVVEISTAVANKDQLPKDIFERLYSGEGRKRPINGEAYSLFYWDVNQWKYICTEIATNNQIVFTEVPKNALLYLADNDNKFIGRCFTLNNGKMNWW